jgi:hypothetical protein
MKHTNPTAYARFAPAKARLKVGLFTGRMYAAFAHSLDVAITGM